jgi:hypothetical protein
MKATVAADKESLVRYRAGHGSRRAAHPLEGARMVRRSIASFVVLILALVALFVPAQASAQTAITAGVKGGVNVANVDLKLTGFTVSAKSRPGLVIGGFLALDKKAAGLVVEGLFSQNGTNLTFSDKTVGATLAQEVRIDYILIPVLGRVNLKESKTVLVHLYLGPQFGFKTGFQSKETLTVGGVSTSTTNHDDSNIKGHNIDLAFGGQVDFGRFLVDLRYSLGLTNIDPDTGPEEPEVKNRTFSMMFGVRLK